MARLGLTYSDMNRREWKALWRSVRRGTTELARSHRMSAGAVTGKRTVARLATWSADKFLLDLLMTKRHEMSKTDRRAILTAIRG